MERLTVVCLCLVSCSGVTSAEQNELLVVDEGRDVILSCSISSNLQLMVFDWKKDGKEVFLYDAGFHYNNGRTGQDEQFKGRVSHFADKLRNGNASILITNTKLADRGNYSCAFPRLTPPKKFYIQLVVDPILKDRSDENIPGAAQKPSVTILKTDDGALLHCEVQRTFPKPKVEWWDSAGNVFPDKGPQVTETAGSYDIILQASVTKTDTFRCVVTQEEIHHRTEAEIYAINGAAPEPSVTILKTDDGALLQCVVRGASPKPKVEWWDSAGNILPAEEPQVTEREGRYDIILQASLTKTDTFRCVVTQEELHHRTEAEIYAINDSSSRDVVVAVVVAVVVTFFITLLVGAAVFCAWRRFRKNQKSKGSQRERSLSKRPPSLTTADPQEN